MNTRELIIALRGGVPSKCDFCGKVTESSKLHPEEAGAWVCIECLDKWDKLDNTPPTTKEG